MGELNTPEAHTTMEQDIFASNWSMIHQETGEYTRISSETHIILEHDTNTPDRMVIPRYISKGTVISGA